MNAKTFRVNIYHPNKGTLKKHFQHVNPTPKTVFGWVTTYTKELTSTELMNLKKDLEELDPKFRVHLTTATTFEITTIDRANHNCKETFYEFADNVEDALCQLAERTIGVANHIISSITVSRRGYTESFVNFPFTLSDALKKYTKVW